MSREQLQLVMRAVVWVRGNALMDEKGVGAALLFSFLQLSAESHSHHRSLLSRFLGSTATSVTSPTQRRHRGKDEIEFIVGVGGVEVSSRPLRLHCIFSVFTFSLSRQ